MENKIATVPKPKKTPVDAPYGQVAIAVPDNRSPQVAATGQPVRLVYGDGLMQENVLCPEKPNLLNETENAAEERTEGKEET